MCLSLYTGILSDKYKQEYNNTNDLTWLGKVVLLSNVKL